MSAAVIVTAVAVPAAVVLAAAPPGALGRWAIRRRRPDVAAAGRAARPSGAPRRAHRRLAPPHALAAAVEAVGRPARRVLRRPPDTAADRRSGLVLLTSLAVAVIVSPVVAVPVAGLMWAVPAVRRRSRRVAHERAVRVALPDTVDLFRLAVGAGLSVHQAVDAVADRSPSPVDAALQEVRRRVAMGARLGDALDVLDGLGDPALPLAAALRGAARYGSPLNAALERVAADARMQRRRRAEEDARRLPVQLLFPLVLCVLPAFGLLAVVPLLLASLRSLQL